ncbi:MAG: hypothetical protein PUD80_05790 [Firmicutes bacterium]|nr:hypothetical protein [Bacillota bacterium]
MKQYRFPERKIWKAAFGVLLTAMLFLARDSMFTTAVIGFEKSQFLMLGVICAAGLAFLIVNRRNWKQLLTDRRMAAILICAAVCLLPMFVKGDWQLMYFSVLLCLLFGIFLTYFVKLREAARYYVVILTVLGAYSVLAAYVLRIGVDRGWFAVPVFQNAVGFEFHNFFLSVVPDSYVKNRNFGIFREPGVYQFFLITALYLNNYEVNWEKNWQLWLVNGILAGTMVSTFATGGVAEMVLLAVVLFFDKKWYRNRRICAVAAVLILTAAAVIGVSIVQQNQLYWEVYSMAIGKFVNGQDSSVERMEAVAVDLNLFFHHPLFGAKLAEVLHAVENNTTSTLILFAGFGVLGGSLSLAAWISLVWKRERKLWVNLALLVILLASFNTQNLIADVFFWLFPVMALVERVLPGQPRHHGRTVTE